MLFYTPKDIKNQINEYKEVVLLSVYKTPGQP
jgi:hypothetical protein